MKKIAIVAFNLGGPDKPESIEPFLFNLFNDPAIIGAPGPVRWLLARFISKRRAPVAREIYKHLGGGSPLLALTEDQCRALERELARDGGETEYRAFVAMRYWHPMSLETAERVRDYGPDEVVLLPLYPQYSTTTTGSSLKEWKRAADAVGLDAPSRAVCCYPENAGWIGAQAELVAAALADWPDGQKVRVLFSAHGLPKKIVAAGDPYQWQVERTAAAVVDALCKGGRDGLDSVVCYQSRVGPLEWIGPSTDDEIARAGGDGAGVIVVPVAFVSEHSETLVELDIEYRDLAADNGVPRYVRVPAVATEERFVAGLAAIVRGALARSASPACESGIRICPADRSGCPMRIVRAEAA